MDLLENIFSFHDQRALSCQSTDVCQRLLDHFFDTLLKFRQASVPNRALSLVKDKYQVYWIPKYACAVLYTPICVGTMSLVLVGLDQWKKRVHSSTEGRETTAVADVTKPARFSLEGYPEGKLQELFEEFEARLRQSEANSGNNRRQSAGNQGNQKTPSFAYVILRQLLSGNKENMSVQGGTTDVGLHTGCVKRNTSFPLVLSCLWTMLVDSSGAFDDQLFHKYVVTYFMHLLHGISSSLISFDRKVINRAMVVIREIEEWFGKIHDDEFKSSVLAKVETYHHQMEALAAAVSSNIRMLSKESVKAALRGLKSPDFPVAPVLDNNMNQETRLKLARKNVAKNLNQSNLDSENFYGNIQDAWVQIAKLNRFFWMIATQLADTSISHDISTLRSKVALYEKAVKVAREATVDNPHVMTVVLRSSEVLAVWICFCWAHREAEQKHPLFQPYTPALDPSHLQYLALEDATAMHALQCVRAFLQRRSVSPGLIRSSHNRLSSAPFRREEDTFVLAHDFVRKSPSLVDIHTTELSRAIRLIEERYEKILKTQRELRQLDSELEDAQAKLSSAIRAKSNAVTYNAYTGKIDYTTRAYRDAETHESRCRQTVSTIQSQIDGLERRRPDDLTFPLPKNQELALKWLFFIYMPKEFRDLSALAHLGQSKLLEKVPSSKSGNQDLRSWFVRWKSVSNTPTPLDQVLLYSNHTMPSLGKVGIRNYLRDTGVYFPDGLYPRPVWKSGDPFAEPIDSTKTTLLFTETLPRDPGSKFLQQFVALVPNRSRGNVGIAQQQNKPDWLLKEDFLQFSVMRAFPNTQIRQLVLSMVDGTLPFENRCVHTLVKQLLYHVGQPGWKDDLKSPWKGLEHLLDQMARQADILRQSPSNSSKLVLFGAMSAFLGQLHDNDASHAREFSWIARAWADGVNGEIKARENVPPGIVPPELYWKQAKFYGYVLLCHTTGDREQQDFLEIAEAVVLFRNRMLFASGTFETDPLDQAVSQVMATRINGLIEAVESQPSHLTRCLSLVIENLPADLIWKPASGLCVGRNGCFEAFSGHLYTVNLLNGVVLVDGVPPGFLPHSIVDDPFYKRTFGSRNFETIVLGFQHYRSARSVGDEVLYEFLYDANEQLQILELDVAESTNSNSDDPLLLLRKDGLDLPVLLQEKHSHWYSERQQAVFLRGTSYRDRAIRYVMKRDSTYIVPVKHQNSNWNRATSSLSTCDRLLLGMTDVGKTLERIENKKYIHISTDPSSKLLRFTLPRCKLTFEHTNQNVASKEFAGFSLCRYQRLDHMLIGVESYLVLQNDLESKKVLIPFGDVDCQGNSVFPEHLNRESGYYTYDVHGRFGNLVSTTCVGRLHLAAMYAASSTLLTERRLSKTGMMVATELVRQCWTNEPLSIVERSKLEAVSKHSNMSCTLRLICAWLWQSSNRVRFLHSEEVEPMIPCLQMDVLAADEYAESRYSPRLLPPEALLLLCTVRPAVESHPLQMPFQSSQYSLHVQSVESYLRTKCVVEVQQRKSMFLRSQKASDSFPFPKPPLARGLEAKVYDDLVSSWDLYKALPGRETAIDEEGWLGALKVTRELREKVEAEVHDTLSMAGDDSIEHCMSRISGSLPVASSLDLLRMSWDENWVREFNPFLRSESRNQCRRRIVEWMMLCVLEDKLTRMLRIQDKHKLIEELDCLREWSPMKYPRWVAFEVEQRLQIRPYQFAIVKQLLAEPGTCTQLNMGLGKTRVLLPMLIMELVQRKVATVRVTALHSIFHEAVDYFRTVLVASAQHIRVHTLPFHREKSLEPVHSSILTEQMRWCKEFSGCLFVTPQHRNSLLLKQYDNGTFVDGLKYDFADVLDESDALLDPSFQLVYATGTQKPLPDGPRRWTMIEALLTTLASNFKCELLSGLLADPDLVRLDSSRFGSFPKFRLLEAFKKHEGPAGRCLCQVLLQDPPHELRWMKQVPPEKVETLIDAMTDPEFPTDSVINDFNGDVLADILAARGCLAHGIIFHGLYSRYRVNYGLHVSSKKMMAVPYAASDTPKLRAEYSHPDMAILYTCLSYYHEGLSISQLRESLVCVQKLGHVAREVVYEDWISSIRTDSDPFELSKFDHILKVDIENKILLDLMFKHLRQSMTVINFWMNNFVFPDCTDQFTSQRSTSAWNLVDSGCGRGFSGTDDTRFHLPLDIKQVPPSDPKLISTNGAMIDRILSCTSEVIVLNDRKDNPLWREILSLSVSMSMSALIDTAGLMAGSMNHTVAEYIAELFRSEASSAYCGVVYYDVECNYWGVYELENSRRIPLRSSSLTESECFVYFDQSRCRGADMKLQSDARALVTVEPNLPKDKFLQGCMRMRNLHPGGQTLMLAGTSECVSHDMTTKEVFERILNNTVRMIRRGLVTFFERGMTYYSFPKEVKQDVSLRHMYSRSLNGHMDLRQLLESSYEVSTKSTGQKKLIKYCKEIGEGADAEISRLAEECEQELEKEVEQEEEEELQLPSALPYLEVDWNFKLAFSNPDELFVSGVFLPLAKLTKQDVPDLAKAVWSPKLHCSKNFWHTITRPSASQSLSHYLRPVNSMLCLKDGRVALLSEYETDQLLPLWRKSIRPKATLQHLATVVQEKGFGKEAVPVVEAVLTAVKLFRGYVQFEESEQVYLDELFRRVHSRSFAQNLLAMRGRLRFFDMSYLDNFSATRDYNKEGRICPPSRMTSWFPFLEG